MTSASAAAADLYTGYHLSMLMRYVRVFICVCIRKVLNRTEHVRLSLVSGHKIFAARALTQMSAGNNVGGEVAWCGRMCAQTLGGGRVFVQVLCDFGLRSRHASNALAVVWFC